MARPARAAFVTLLATALCAGLVSSARAVPGSAQTTRQAAAQAPAVLAPATTEGAAPTAAGIGKALAAVLKDPSLGPHHGIYVYDASRGKPVF